MQSNVTFKGSAQRLQKRNISEKTCEFYKIYRDETHLRFPYFDGSGRIQGFKTKSKLKEFKYEGVSTDTLFGQHLFPTNGKRIVITEGELDAASCYEAMPNWPMVSLPHGAASAKKDIQNKYLYYKGMRKSSSSLTMTTPEEMLLKKQRQSYLRERSRLLAWSNTKMRQMRYKRMILKLLDGLSGMLKSINPMG
ncbi:hypothetical protein HOT87_gp06 [uncultured phage MedDCM-OCT-S05-C849]|uniref:Uncharacterized protein n=1 Tax=uncultured phage MedDCM-OCT-S05-C849 TaxID=743565 RepID=D6PI51_9CAUD|nr:hypothetical protein HOT87_gp06 [uncultured phage MedDCM-OCT-S05-C849]ADD95402.1 hypothetical protein [uncultured phage MedDCM-OCT-S05-C849]